MSSRSCVRQRWAQTSYAGCASETRTTRLGIASTVAMATEVMAHADDPRTTLLAGVSVAARVRETVYCPATGREFSFGSPEHATIVINHESCSRDPSHDGLGSGLSRRDLRPGGQRQAGDRRAARPATED